MIEEIIVSGYIQIPYPYLEDFKIFVQNSRNKFNYKNYSDFITEPIECIGNAISSFSYIFKYEKDFEMVLLNRFIDFIKSIKFLTAILCINGDEQFFQQFQFIYDGKDIFLFKNLIKENSESIKI